MKSSIKKNTFKAIYRLLDKVSPIQGDCGRLCGAACCTPEGDETSPDAGDFELGIYLLPGEEKLFTRRENWLKWTWENAEDYDFPDSWHGKVFFIRCIDPPRCRRDMRPLQCRTYPLAPHIDSDGYFSLVLSTADTPYKCPLISEDIALDPKFIKASFTVWKRLIEDPLIYDLVKMDSEFRMQDQV